MKVSTKYIYAIHSDSVTSLETAGVLGETFLDIDSLQALDLLTRLEHHFHVELPDYELQGVTDFRTLASRIQARL